MEKHAYLILLAVTISLLGCYHDRTPIFIAQMSVLPYGKRQILKDAFEKYPYFRNTGWQQAVKEERVAVIVTAKPTIDQIISDIKARANDDKIALDQFNSNEEKYRQYLTTVAYDFTFYVNGDGTVTNGGLIVREFMKAEGSTKKRTPDEQGLILRTVAEQAFPTWIEQDMRQKLSLD